MSLFDQYNWQGERGFPYHWGYYWLGPIQVPPLPQWIGLTDRITNVIWYFTFANDLQHLVFTSTAPSQAPLKIYGAWDGPFVGQQGFRMGISNGHVTVDVYDGMGPGPFARNQQNFQAIAGVWAVSVSGLGYDHLGFLVGSATNSIFAAPKTSFFDQFRQGSDVLGP